MIKVKSEGTTNFLFDYAPWISLGVGILFLAAGFFWLILPQFGALASVNQEIKDKQLVLATGQANIQAAKSLLAKYEKLQISENENLDKINSLLPQENNHEAVISNLEAIVLHNGLLINSVSIAPQDKKADGSSLPANLGAVKISLDLIGVDYQALKNILTAIEHNLRMLDVVAVKFSPKDASANLDILAYYLNEKDL